MLSAMKPVWIALVMVACNGNDLDKQKAEMDKQAHASDPPPSAPVPKQIIGSAAPPSAGSAKTPAAPIPDPTTPEELDKALKQAMIDQRDKDVLRFCDMSKLDAKSNPQSVLGCTLSACRTKDADTAHKYSALLTKEYRDAATRVCMQNQVGI
jgi:hypothetical protein